MKFIVIVVFALAFLFLLNNWLAPSKAGSSSWTVYGTDGCGWTRKQLKELDAKGVTYKYINCENEDCGDIRSFPTLKDSSGAVKVGFTTF
jgi:hypothetical protein